MNRRMFLRALSCVPFVGLLATKPARAHYLFDWSLWRSGEGPFTEDPDWKGKLSHGPHNWLRINGCEIHVTSPRFMTGPQGWVDVYAYDLRTRDRTASLFANLTSHFLKDGRPFHWERRIECEVIDVLRVFGDVEFFVKHV